MKKIALIATVLVLSLGQPAHAFFTDDAIAALMYAEQKTYDAFMHVQIIQEIAILKQNYDASVRYYNQFQQLNSGNGLSKNIATQLRTSQQQENFSLEQQINSTFINTYNTNTNTDKLYQTIDQGIVNNINYASSEMANVTTNRNTGQQIAANASGLAPKDAANLSAKTEGLELQMLTQIHEDNLRIIQLQSMQLSAQATQTQGQAQSISNITQSLQSRYPNAGLGQGSGQ